MAHIRFRARVLLLGFVSLFICSGDTVVQSAPLSQEHISSFDTVLAVEKEGSVLVTETIHYTTGGVEKHGIFREIPRTSAEGKKMSIQVISITDKEGKEHPFEESDDVDVVNIKIGDPQATFSGDKVYVIRYRATRAVSYYDQFDEIYWNTTGNQWPFPILAASARVELPGQAVVNQYACYQGVTGSTAPCRQTDGIFVSSTPLQPGEGLTVAVGFSKGIVQEKLTTLEWLEDLLHKAGLVIAVVLVLWVAGAAFWRWRTKGRDPKGRGIVVPEYTIPNNLTPLEAAGILGEATIATKAYMAHIVSFATRGYLRIHQTQEKKLLGLMTTEEYVLERLPKNDELKNFDVLFLEKLFSGQQQVSLSDLKNSFYKEIPAINKAVLLSLKQEGYYKTLQSDRALSSWKEHVPLLVAAGIFGLGFLTASVSLLIGAGIAVAIWILFSYFQPQKTEKGIQTKEYLQGLKLYIQKAEKARLEFHDAPEKNPELFSTLLPFAMVFGVVDIWIKEFQDLGYQAPSWYVATNAEGSSLNGNFFHNFESFSHNFASFGSSPGSSGGGSSGGGGGGGGGGSW